jgi:hypothetical protein
LFKTITAHEAIFRLLIQPVQDSVSHIVTWFTYDSFNLGVGADFDRGDHSSAIWFAGDIG